MESSEDFSQKDTTEQALREIPNYNQGPMIKLQDIPPEDMSQALKDFSEGSEGLEICLRTMWNNNLETIACCAGNENSFERAYILMDEGVDIFSFLSEELLSDDMVSIISKDNRQSISFGGRVQEKEEYFKTLAEDIISGKKDNEHLLQDKVGKPLSEDWIKKGMVYTMLNNAIPKVGLIQRKKLEDLCKALNDGTVEEQDRIMPECYKELTSIVQN